jgi:hypothetical protein
VFPVRYELDSCICYIREIKTALVHMRLEINIFVRGKM